MPAKSVAPFVLPDALLTAFDASDRINQYLIENLPAEAWRAEPPQKKGRDIAGIFAHMHNVRVMWLKAAGGEVPDQLDRHAVTPVQAKKGLKASRAALHDVISHALSGTGRIKGFRPDVAGFCGYLIAHDAHHRGQITMLARQTGHPIRQKSHVWHMGMGCPFIRRSKSVS